MRRRRTCPDCDGRLQRIRLIDKSPQGGARLVYSSLDAEPSSWTGAFPMVGAVAGLVCQGCGRVLLYAIDYEERRQRRRERETLEEQARGRLTLEGDASGGLTEPEG